MDIRSDKEACNRQQSKPAIHGTYRSDLLERKQLYPVSNPSDFWSNWVMMLTTGAIKDVNANTPSGIHFDFSEMTDPSKSIQCGTWYLKLLIGRWGTTKTALEHYGTGVGYADNLLKCEQCLKAPAPDPIVCLKQIHP